MTDNIRDRGRERYRGAKLAIALALVAVAAGKFYLDRDEWATALARQPQVRPSSPDFDLSRATIPREEIRAGGPPKDGIPALTDPEFIAADRAQYLRPDDRVAGVVIGGDARAYPLRILTWHEVVNDTIQGVPVVVSYCPLCDSVAAFDRRTPEGVKEFGVSGLLYNSNVLMYDRGGRSEGLWSQLKAEAVSGPQAGQPLRALPVELTTWRDWRARHPDTTVLSARTGHPRDYRADPYRGYLDRPGLMFPARPTSDLLPEKAKVLGVWSDGAAKAYPLAAFADRREPTLVKDEVAGRKLTLRYDPRSESLRVVEADEGLRWMYSLWFAWYAFHPETEIAMIR
ncbi:DUF3179 domain-containing protein [Tautonia sociabilis]|nr:DUF3179 domain-containing protein [Tautonia sociabilis]